VAYSLCAMHEIKNQLVHDKSQLGEQIV